MAKGKLIKNKAIYQKLFLEFNSRARPKPKVDKKKKERYLWTYNDLYEGREFGLNAFKSGIFPLKPTQGKGIRISTLKKWFKYYQYHFHKEKQVIHQKTYYYLFFISSRINH